MSSVAIFVLLLANMSTLAFNVQPVNAAGTIYIRADGSIDPFDASISTFDNVTYTFTGNVNESIVIERDSIIVDGAGYTVIGSGSGNGIALTGRINVTVRNVAITGFYVGIWLGPSSSGNTLSGNKVMANNGGGIYVYSSSNNILSGNSATASSGDGIALGSSSSNNVLSGNNVAYNAYGIRLDSSPNNLLSDNNVRNNGYGIKLGYSSNNTLSGNNITNNDHGIHLDSSSNNLVGGNNVNANNLSGIYLYSSAGNDVYGNNVTANPFYGGIYLYSSSNNIVRANNVSANKGSSISLQVGCLNNIISENSITYNEGIVSLYYSSSNNKFHHNNFINNTHQVYLNSSGANVWDDGYPSGGNYWSDYNGTDANHDGIGDTAYVIDANNTDNHPLMGMFNSYNVTYHTPPIVPHACNVTVISNSTISDLVAPIWIEHPEVLFLQFNVSGAEGSTGFCRVSFPTAMMKGTYHVSVNGIEIPYTLLPFSDANYSYLYFDYTHSTQQVTIIPEFPSFLILPLFFIATLLAGIVYRRKHFYSAAR